MKYEYAVRNIGADKVFYVVIKDCLQEFNFKKIEKLICFHLCRGLHWSLYIRAKNENLEIDLNNCFCSQKRALIQWKKNLKKDC